MERNVPVCERTIQYARVVRSIDQTMKAAP